MLKLPEQRAFEDALRAPDPMGALIDVVQHRLMTAGASRHDLLDSLEEFRGILKRQHLDADEDVVLEVMDFLAGWASPHMSLTAEGQE
jgi:hypothetical protein